MWEKHNAWQNVVGLNAVHPIAVQALRILEDETQCDIIKVGGLIRNKVSPTTFVAGCVGGLCARFLLICGAEHSLHGHAACAS